MKILIIVDCYYPSTKSSAKLTHDLGVEFANQGHQVTVLTPSETIPKEFEVTVEDGVTILRVKMGKIKGTNKIVRAFREMRLSTALWNKAKSYLLNHPNDLIVFYSPSIFFGQLVKKLKVIWQCPAYLVLRDIFPQWALDAGVLKKGMAYLYFRFKELQQYQVADIIGVQSPANLQYFNEKLRSKIKCIEVLYNWTLIDENKSYSTSSHRSSLGLEDKVVFFYGGNIGVAQDMDNIIRLAHRLREEESVYFLLVGEGSETERLKAIINTLDLNNIGIYNSVSQDEYLCMLSEFDVGLISLDRNLKTQNMPGKMLGYMQFSLPILASINPGNDLGDLLKTYGAGLVSFNGEDDILYEQAMTLAKNARLRKELGQNARQLLTKYFSSISATNQILTHLMSETANSPQGVTTITKSRMSIGHTK